MISWRRFFIILYIVLNYWVGFVMLLNCFNSLRQALCYFVIALMISCGQYQQLAHSSVFSMFSELVQQKDEQLNKKWLTSKNNTDKTASTLSDESVSELAQRYKDSTFEVVDASETQLDGAAAIIVTFSTPLNAKQNFDDSIILIDGEKGIVDGAWELSKNLMELTLRFVEPDRKLILTIKPTIEDINGQKLDLVKYAESCDDNDEFDNCFKERKNSYQQEIKTRQIYPTVGFASKGVLLSTSAIEGLPVTAINVDKIDVNFFRVKNAQLISFLQARKTEYSRSSLTYWQSSELLPYTDLVYTGRFDLSIRKNVRENQLLPLKNIPELQQEGVYFAVMSAAGKYAYSNPVIMFTISDIGVSAHRYNDQLAFFTQSLADGRVLSATKVTLFDNNNKILDKGVTDENGYLALSGKQIRTAYLALAEQKGRSTLLMLDSTALDLTEFDINGELFNDKQVFAFGPRDLYRPGESVYVNALLRDANGELLPEQPIKVDILKPDNQIYKSFVWQAEKGLYKTTVRLPDDAAAGKWALKLNTGDDHYQYYSFKVEDFLPERMAMEITNESISPVLSNKSIDFTIKGWYLYGAPASENQLQGQLYLRPKREIATLPNFEIGSITETNISRRLNMLESKLNHEGIGAIEINKDEWNGTKSPIEIILQASLMDAGGRPINRRSSQVLWPAENMPAVRALFGEKEIYDYRSNGYVSRATVDENSNAEFEVAYINREGQKLAKELSVRLIRERDNGYWSWSDSYGWRYEENYKELNMAQEDITVAKEGIATVSFPVDYGRYRIEVIDKNNGILTSKRFWAGYSWQDNTNGTDSVRPDQVKLKIDKPAYKLGEKMNVNVQAPTEGSGYLLVESSSGTLWQQAITIPAEGANFEVPLDLNWKRHDLYLSAIIVRPADNKSKITVKRAVGVLHIPTNNASRELAVELGAAEQVLPNQTTKIKIKVTTKEDAVPEKITVLVSAVDSGILNITNYVTPDPFRFFLGRKRYSVDQWDIYGQLIESGGNLAKLAFGGDSDDLNSDLSRSGKKPPSTVQLLSQQLNEITLNSKGEGEIDLAIPDFNGEVRIMAQAWTDQEFGKADKLMKIAAPLVAELTTPRFLANGDKSLLALNLHNLSDKPQQFTVNVKTDGLISIDEQTALPLELAVNERKIFQIPITADSGFGVGQITIKTEGVKSTDDTVSDFERSWSVGVRSAYPATTSDYFTTLTAGNEWVLSYAALEDLVSDSLQAQLVVSSIPPLNIGKYIRELYAYPYGCLEQTTSGIYPSLYVNQQQLNKLGIKTMTDEKRHQNINVGIGKLIDMQLTNGGFGFWSKMSQEVNWGTVYVTDFLLRARQQGYNVQQDALSKAITRLQQYIQNSNVLTSNINTFTVKAYAALVLAKQNQIPLAALRKIYDEKASAPSGLSLVQLGIALKLAGDETKGQELIISGLGTVRKAADWIGDYGSEVRDTALILSLFMEYNILPDEQNRLLLLLSKQLANKRYFSTQERNALFLAGYPFMNKQEIAWKLTLNSEQILEDKMMSRLLEAKDLATGLTLANNGNNTLYTQLNVVGYPKVAPKPSQNVLAVQREFLDLTGNPISLTNLKSGDLVLATVKVTTSEQVSDALLVDLLPAGLELENQNLSNSSVSLEQSTDNIRQLMKAMQESDIKHQEYRDDRYVAAFDVSRYKPVVVVYLARAVIPGNYAVPPSYVESMYRPEWYSIGNTPGQLIISK